MTDDPVDDGDLVYTRIFAAPRELVFRCLVEPAELTHFWGPIGVSAPLRGLIVDLRPGGAFETVMVNDSDGAEYRMRAVYLEVRPPDRLVWRDLDNGVITTTIFVDLGDSRCEVAVRQANVPEAFRSPQARAGFSTSLDRFAAHLATLTGNPPPTPTDN